MFKEILQEIAQSPKKSFSAMTVRQVNVYSFIKNIGATFEAASFLLDKIKSSDSLVEYGKIAEIIQEEKVDTGELLLQKLDRKSVV